MAKAKGWAVYVDKPPREVRDFVMGEPCGSHAVPVPPVKLSGTFTVRAAADEFVELAKRSGIQSAYVRPAGE